MTPLLPPTLVVVPCGPHQMRLVARVDFAAGDTLSALRLRARGPERHRHTIQVGEAEHALLEPEGLRFVDHACAPSAYFDLDHERLVAARAIRSGEAVSAFYPATEWAMAEPFDCHCGSTTCLGRVVGAHALTVAAFTGRHISRHIARALASRGASGPAR